MKIQPYLDKLSGSKEYKDFIGKYKDAYLIAGFFVLDLEEKKNIHQIDYYLPKEKKVAAFTLDHGVTLQILDTISSKTPQKLDLKTNIDLDALAGILHDEMRNRSMSEDIKKIVAVIQNIEGKKIWNLNCILSGMEILKAHVEDESKSVLKMDKNSVFDYIKKIPAGNLAKMTGNISTKVEDPELAKKKIEELDKLEKEIEKQKEEIQKSLKEAKKESVVDKAKKGVKKTKKN